MEEQRLLLAHWVLQKLRTHKGDVRPWKASHGGWGVECATRREWSAASDAVECSARKAYCTMLKDKEEMK